MCSSFWGDSWREISRLQVWLWSWSARKNGPFLKKNKNIIKTSTEMFPIVVVCRVPFIFVHLLFIVICLNFQELGHFYWVKEFWKSLVRCTKIFFFWCRLFLCLLLVFFLSKMSRNDLACSYSRMIGSLKIKSELTVFLINLHEFDLSSNWQLMGLLKATSKVQPHHRSLLKFYRTLEGQRY